MLFSFVICEIKSYTYFVHKLLILSENLSEEGDKPLEM